MGHQQTSGTGESAAPYLVVATSARALAVSARRGGHAVCAADAFGDRDTRQAAWRLVRLPANGLELKAEHLARRLKRISEQVPFTGLVYGSGLEHCPEILTALGRRLPVLGNAARVLRESQDPRRLARWIRGLQIDVPETSDQPPADPQGWLLKPCGGNGGVGVRLATSAEASAQGHYYQRLVPGETLSASFLADGHQARLLGIHQQFCADPAVTGGPFVHGGGVIRPDLLERLGPRFQALADRLTRRAGLRGLNGVDCVLQGDRLWLLELNARPCASMDLYDPGLPDGLFHWHLAAVRGELPELPADTACRGYRVVYAPRDLRVRADVRWPPWVSDRPAPRQIVPAGAPVCTVAAEGADHQAVQALLTRRSGLILEHHVDGRKPSWWPLRHHGEHIFTSSSSRGITT